MERAFEPSVQKLRKTAKQYFEGVPPSHDWYHVERVETLCRELAEEEEARNDILVPAALLHDIGRNKENAGQIQDHARWGADEARRILSDRGYDEDTLEAVHHCILTHRYSNEAEPRTLEAKVLSDADNLDAMGAVGVARTFSFSGEKGRPLADPGLLPEQDDSESGETGLNHLKKKILNLKDRIYTEHGQKLAQERHDFVLDFVKKLRDEIQ